MKPFTRSILLLALAFAAWPCVAQPLGEKQVVWVLIQGSDTMPCYFLDTATVVGAMGETGRKRQARYDRLTRNVVKVYPYARITSDLLAEYEHDLRKIADEDDQKLYTKLAEAELRAEFEEEVKGLTVSQGRVLMKLIDRETGQTTYALVKQLRGGFQAWLWQGIAKLFGNDMKDDYDPAGDDAMVEHIVVRIERGELVVAGRKARTEKAQARLEKRKARLYKRHGLPMPPTSMK